MKRIIYSKFDKSAISELPRVTFPGEIVTVTSEEEAEEALADACSEGMLWLRMDRVKRIVVFKQPKRAESR